jgi:hypothetical protein
MGKKYKTEEEESVYEFPDFQWNWELGLKTLFT